MQRPGRLLAAPMLGGALVLGAFVPSAGHPFEIVRPFLAAVLLGVVASVLAVVVTRSTAIAAWVACSALAWLLGSQLFAVVMLVGLGGAAFNQGRRMRGLSPWSPRTSTVLAVPGILLVISAGQLVATGVVSIRDLSMGVPMDRATASHSPNIHVLLLDGYPRADTLKVEFGIDNTRFLATLEGMGFSVVDDSASVFPGTNLTLASSMLDAPYELTPLNEIDSPGDLWTTWREIRRTYLVNVPLMNDFRRIGYTLRYIPSEVGISEWRGWDVTVDSGHLTDTEALIVQRSPLRGLLADWVMDQRRQRVLASLESWANATTGGPWLNFAHVMPPHAPFLWGPSGTTAEPPTCWFHHRCELATTEATHLGFSIDEYARHIEWQLTELNRLVIDAVEEIALKDPQSVVIIFSDHGLRYSRDSEDEWYKTLLAGRIPRGLPVDLGRGPDALFVRVMEGLRQ